MKLMKSSIRVPAKVPFIFTNGTSAPHRSDLFCVDITSKTGFCRMSTSDRKQEPKAPYAGNDSDRMQKPQVSYAEKLSLSRDLTVLNCWQTS